MRIQDRQKKKIIKLIKYLNYFLSINLDVNRQIGIQVRTNRIRKIKIGYYFWNIANENEQKQQIAEKDRNKY